MEELLMTKRSVVRLDDYRFPTGDVFSVKATDELENGFVGVLGETEADNRDVRKLEKPKAGDSLVLVANPALVYDNARLGSGLEDKYFMEAGEVVRAYGLRPTMKFGVSKEGVNGAAKVGDYLVAGAGWKLVPSATKPADGFAAKVIRFDTVGGALAINATQTPTVYVVVEVV